MKDTHNRRARIGNKIIMIAPLSRPPKKSKARMVHPKKMWKIRKRNKGEVHLQTAQVDRWFGRPHHIHATNSLRKQQGCIYKVINSRVRYS